MKYYVGRLEWVGHISHPPTYALVSSAKGESSILIDVPFSSHGLAEVISGVPDNHRFIISDRFFNPPKNMQLNYNGGNARLIPLNYEEKQTFQMAIRA